MSEHSDSTPHTLTTLDATIVQGEPVGRGSERAYHRLVPDVGEPHRPRTDLFGRPAERVLARPLRPLLTFVHVTDYQLADPASPGRVDFVQRLADRPGWEGMVPAYRPQEVVSTHAFEAMARTVAAVAAASQAGRGQPVRFVLTTGDNTDSAQLNELHAFLSLMDGGGTIDPSFGAVDSGDAKAIPSHTVSGEYFNPEPESRDRYKRCYGFPDLPGLLSSAARPISTQGFGIPWLGCFGNHDCLVQGRARVTQDAQKLFTGGRRPVGPPRTLPTAPSDEYLADPTALSTGPALPVRPRADRRIISKAEYIQAHLDSPGSPRGHGFTEHNLAEGIAYYCYDEIPGIRLIVLDTTHPAGHVTGSIGQRQRDWLEDRLVEVHSAYRDAAGDRIRTRHVDKAVILASHHGLSMLDNTTEWPDGAAQPDADLPRFFASDVEALLHRFDNVVLWLAGHEHINSVVPRPGAGAASGAGFWHLITSGLCEWPCQARLLELLLPEPEEASKDTSETEQNTLVIRSTMIDHAGPVAPGSAHDLWELAAAHRELCANEPTRVGGPQSAGTVQDRNVDLFVPISSSLAAALRGLC